MKSIDYGRVASKLNDLKEAGEAYLLEALKTDFSNANISNAFHDTFCSGCSACTAVCPVHAIDLKKNTSGYYEACVDEEKCIHCGKCIKVCQRFTDMKGRMLYEAVPYALQSRNKETVLSSSSGGIAHEIAQNALERGEKVVGCTYNCKNQEAEHVLINDPEALDLLKGSKYLQSNPQQAFSEMIKAAVSNKELHFTVFGTPCQIAGSVKAAELQHVRDQFLFVEIFCHGVPTYKLWDYQKQKIENDIGSPLDSVSFRNKQYGWHTYCLKAEHDGEEWTGTREKTEFWLSYFEDGLLNRSCMVCKCRGSESLADIRIGDYWGARYADRTDGVSAVLCITEKGKAAVNRLNEEDKVKQMECGTVDEILSTQNMKGYTITESYRQAQKMLQDGEEIGTVIRKYHNAMPPKKKAKRLLLQASSALPKEFVTKIKTVRSR